MSRRQNRGGRLTSIGGRRVVHVLDGISSRAETANLAQLRVEIDDFLVKFGEIGPREAAAADAVRLVVLWNGRPAEAKRDCGADGRVYKRCMELLQREVTS